MQDANALVGQIIEGLDPGAFVTKFVLVAEVIGTDGARAVWVQGGDDLTRWDTLGLLLHALDNERSGFVVDALRDDDEC